jgi:cytochrome c
MRIVTFVAALATGALVLVASDAPPVQAQAESAQVRQGAELYAKHCAMCHGASGEGGAAFKTPIFGAGNQLSKFKTALGLFEYNQLLMPFDNPARMNDQEKLAVVAFQLHRSGMLPAGRSIELANAGSLSIAGR